MFTVLVHDKNYHKLIHFVNSFVILFEYCFMFNLSRKIHVSIIVCFVLINFLLFCNFLIGFIDFQLKTTTNKTEIIMQPSITTGLPIQVKYHLLTMMKSKLLNFSNNYFIENTCWNV